MLLLAAINLHVVPFLVILPRSTTKRQFFRHKLRPREVLVTGEGKTIGADQALVPSNPTEAMLSCREKQITDGITHEKPVLLYDDNGTETSVCLEKSKKARDKEKNISECLESQVKSGFPLEPKSLKQRRYFLLVLFAFSQFCNAFPNFALYLFIPIRCVIQGYTKRQAAALIAIMNVTGCVLRLFAGALGDMKCINVFYVISIATLICGLSLLLSVFCNSFITLAVFTGTFGSATAFFITLVQAGVQRIGGAKELNVGLSMVFAAEGLCGLIFPLSGTLL